jgi:hypothetical protein
LACGSNILTVKAGDATGESPNDITISDGKPQKISINNALLLAVIAEVAITGSCFAG